MKIGKGRVVRMNYTLRDEGGATIESSLGKEPLTYLHGLGSLIPGLEKVLDGSEAGLKTTVTILPRDAYGEKDPQAVIQAARGDFPEGLKLAPGVEVQADTPDGPITFIVISIDGDEVVLDANHPLAGKTLTFDIEVLEVREATADELAHGHVHGPGGAHGHH
jgi:FKBP-type peptidyl-prolyl cis-trans isomerase SlyD